MLNRIRLTFLVLLLASTPVLAASQDNKSFLERFYTSYDVSTKNWRDMPEYRLFSLQNGDPYLLIKPHVDALQHEGSLGFELGDSLFPFVGAENARLEFGGSVGKGVYKTQVDIPVLSNGPISVNIKNSSENSFDASGLSSIRNSYTFKLYSREYFLDYKADYRPSSRITLTPKIGVGYDLTNYSNYLFFYSPEFDSFQKEDENTHAKSWAIRTGIEADLALAYDFSFFCSTGFSLRYNTDVMDARQFDAGGPTEIQIDDKKSYISYTASLEAGVRKKIRNVLLAFSGGIEFYSDVPEILNPIKPGDPDAHLETNSAYNWNLKLSATYYF